MTSCITSWWICTLIWYRALVSNAFLISSIHFILAWANYPHSHMCAYGDPSPMTDIYTLLPWRPILPFPLHYATSLIMAHREGFGESPAVARPSAITIVWHSHQQLPPLPQHHLWLHRCPVCVCASTCVLTRYVRIHMPSSIFVSVCVSVPSPAVLFEIHCHVLMDNLPGPSPGGKGWLLA